jgi:hypothetical protein
MDKKSIGIGLGIGVVLGIIVTMFMFVSNSNSPYTLLNKICEENTAIPGNTQEGAMFNEWTGINDDGYVIQCTDANGVINTDKVVVDGCNYRYYTCGTGGGI